LEKRKSEELEILVILTVRKKTRKAIQNGPHGLAPADAHRESSLASMFELSKKRSCIMTAEFGCA
jgi:hypothetical protein